jgi:hypothetical protein
MRWLSWVLGGLLIGAVASVVAVSAAGGGHGTYLPAAILFPFTMAASAVIGRVPAALVAVALLQFPVYGSLVAISARTNRACVGLAGVHTAVAVAALFLVMRSGNFN